jgi:hypothetical protein
VFNGLGGILTGFVVFVVLWLIAYLGTKEKSFDFDARGEKGAFQPLLSTYLDLAKFVVGLASGSIVLLVGSSALHAMPRLPYTFASPLFLLALSVIYGVLFMICLTLNYEQYRAIGGELSYTRFKYTRNPAFGYGALFCFCIGYGWLVWIVTR